MASDDGDVSDLSSGNLGISGRASIGISDDVIADVCNDDASVVADDVPVDVGNDDVLVNVGNDDAVGA